MRVPEQFQALFCIGLPAWYAEVGYGLWNFHCSFDPPIAGIAEYPEEFWNWTLAVRSDPSLFINASPYWPLPP